MKEQKENIKNTFQAEEEVAAKPDKKSSSTARSVLFGEMLGKKLMIKFLPYLLFVTALALLYISNSYYAEKTIREIEKSNNELKELSAEYISIKTELMSKSKSAEVLKLVSGMGIKSSLNPPKKLVVTAKSK